MTYLKCEEGKGVYTIDGTTWTQIDQIKRDDLLSLVKIALSEEYMFEEYDESKISNQAQQIVYKHICERLSEVNENRKRFHDESELIFKEAIEKYTLIENATT